MDFNDKCTMTDELVDLLTIGQIEFIIQFIIIVQKVEMIYVFLM